MKMSCPDEERLVDYLESRLSEEIRSQIEEHLSDCQICLEGLVVTNGLARGRDRFELDPVPTTVTESAVRLVIHQRALSYSPFIEKLKRSINQLALSISDLLRLSPWVRWQLAPIRGSKKVASEDLVSLRVSFKEIETSIEIEKIAGDNALIRVKLLEPIKSRKALRITLKKGEREIASYLLEGTSVLFEDIPFGHYSISLAQDGLKLGTYLFEIKESQHGGKYE